MKHNRNHGFRRSGGWMNTLALFGMVALAGLGLGVPSSAWAADKEFTLSVSAGEVTMPDGEAVPIWGYSEGASCGAPQLPGPVLEVNEGETVRVTILNCMAMDTSFQVPGLFVKEAALPADAADAVNDETTFGGTTTAASDASGATTYDFTASRPGTFLYESATDMATQVQMGLYGALVVHAADETYDRQAVMVLSDIDPAWHAAPDSYNPVYFKPMYWLINGKAYPDTAEVVAKASTDAETVQPTLVRYVNAGSQDHTMMAQNVRQRIIREDAYPLPFARTAYALTLAPGQTADAELVLDAAQVGVHPFYDHALDITNADHFPGGMITMLRVLDPTDTGVGFVTDAPGYATEGSTFSFDALGVDFGNPDANLTYTLTDTNAAGLMLGTTTGTVTWDTTGAAGDYYALVTVSNGTSTVSRQFDFTVNHSPAIAGASPDSVAGGVHYFKDVSITDADGDAVTAWIQSPPPGMTISNTAGTTWRIDWPAAPASVEGDYDVTVNLQARDDKGGFAMAPYTLTITSTASGTTTDTAAVDTAPITFEVRDFGTNATANRFKWVVVEDNTHHVDPDTGQCTMWVDGAMHTGACVSDEPFQSNTKPVASGTRNRDVDTAGGTVELPVGGRYFVSVLNVPDGVPDEALDTQAARDGGGLLDSAAGAYKQDGTAFEVPAGGGTVTIWAQPNPTPLTQKSVQVFRDFAPLNGQWDVDFEGVPTDANGQPVRFQVMVLDWLGARITQDYWGNPLCTYYAKTAADGGDGTFESLGLTVTDQYIAGVGEPIPGTGENCYTDVNGFLTIPNLGPGKYETMVFPPTGSDWVQTTTLEGSKGIDSLVLENGRGNRPIETLPINFFGFSRPCAYGDGTCATVAGGGTPTTIESTIYKVEPARPPFLLPDGSGQAVDKPWLALNYGLAGDGEQVALVRGNESGYFQIDNVPAGDYTLVVFDDGLDYIMASYPLTIAGGGTMHLNDPNFADSDGLLIPDWWGRLKGTVCYDMGEDGECTGDPGIPGVGVEVHHRDGSLRYDTVTDEEGHYNFRRYFPYGSWLIAGIGYSRWGVTGLHYKSGATEPNGEFVQEDTLQGPQLVIGNNLLEGGTNVLDWAFKPYPLVGNGYDADEPVHNGGISGVTWYATTRNALDIEYASADPWEPAVPNVEVRLYEAITNPATGQLVTVPDTDSTGRAGAAQRGRLLGVVHSDHFSSVPPIDCPIKQVQADGSVADTFDAQCREVLATWNQIRPAVYDGGYQFFEDCRDDSDPANPQAVYEQGSAECTPLLPGRYLVEATVPQPYRLFTANDVNTLTANDIWGPNENPMPVAPLKDPAHCVGPKYLVTAADHPKVGEMVNDCSMHEVVLAEGTNGAADFHMFLDVAPPTRYRGFVNDNLNLEIGPNSPQRGDKHGVPYVPVVARDYRGKQVAKAYTDQNGFFEMLVPSTQRVTAPSPTGNSPGMYMVMANDPGTPDAPDPHFNPNYDTLTMAFQALPGLIEFPDMAINPLNGFLANKTIDCGPPAGTPHVSWIDHPVMVLPPNGNVGNNPTVTIHGSGFDTGAQPVVLLGDDGNGNTASINANHIESWTDTEIVFHVSRDLDLGSNELRVRNSAGAVSETGVSLHMLTGDPAIDPPVVYLQAPVYPPSTDPTGENYPHTVQDAVEAADPGTLIVLGPQTYDGVDPLIYRENVILHKGVSLLGYGYDKSIIDGAFLNPVTQGHWDDLYLALETAGSITVPDLNLASATPATVSVLAYTDPDTQTQRDPQITLANITVQGSRIAPGIQVNAYADNFEAANLHVVNNTGMYAGGIAAGYPFGFGNTPVVGVTVKYSLVEHNGSLGPVGGIAMNDGASGYVLRGNTVCANGGYEGPGGIGHYGRNTGPVARIEDNRVLFNWSYVNGGGIVIEGLPGATPLDLTLGTGRVDVSDNLIQGNYTTNEGSALVVNEAGRDVVYVVNNMMVNNLAAGQGAILLHDSVDVRMLYNTVAKNVSTSTSLGTYVAAGSSEHTAGLLLREHSGVMKDYLASLGMPDRYHAKHGDPYLVGNVFWENHAYIFVDDNPTTTHIGHLQNQGAYDVAILIAEPTPVTDNVLRKADTNLFSEQDVAPLPAFTEASNGTVTEAQNPFATVYENVMTATPVRAAGEVAINPLQVPVTVELQSLTREGDYHLANDNTVARDFGSTSYNPPGAEDVSGPVVYAPGLDIDNQQRFGAGGGYDAGADEYYGP